MPESSAADSIKAYKIGDFVREGTGETEIVVGIMAGAVRPSFILVRDIDLMPYLGRMKSLTRRGSLPTDPANYGHLGVDWKDKCNYVPLHFMQDFYSIVPEADRPLARLSPEYRKALDDLRRATADTLIGSQPLSEELHRHVDGLYLGSDGDQPTVKVTLYNGRTSETPHHELFDIKKIAAMRPAGKPTSPPVAPAGTEPA